METTEDENAESAGNNSNNNATTATEAGKSDDQQQQQQPQLQPGTSGIQHAQTQGVYIAVVVPKCFIKHMCFIVLYFHGHAFFLWKLLKSAFLCFIFWKMYFIFVS